MTSCIVVKLKVIDIAYDDAEFKIGVHTADAAVQRFAEFRECIVIPNAGQIIKPCEALRKPELFLPCFPFPDLVIYIFYAEQDMLSVLTHHIDMSHLYDISVNDHPAGK